MVGLYQFGLIRSVPEPPLPGVDADWVDASGEVYAVLHTPDAALGITSAGGARRDGRRATPPRSAVDCAA